MTDHISIDMLSEIEEAARLGCLVDEYQAINIERDTAWGNEVLWLAKEIRRLQTRRDVALQSRRRAVAAYREYKKLYQGYCTAIEQIASLDDLPEFDHDR
jgi:hypothetical protein